MSARLFLVSGPSGAGTSSLCAALLASRPQLQLTVSCTTRDPRPGEADGREYHFLSTAEFKAQADAGGFLEWANVHGNMYGTRQADVEAIMQGGQDVLLEIDWQGADQVAEKIPSAIRLFILPPSLQELKSRLTARGQDDIETVERRVAAAEDEMAHAGEAHYQITNDDFELSLQRLQEIFQH